jgi:hypothetical protein
MGLSFTIAAGPRLSIHSQVQVPTTLFQVRDFSNLEGQVPVFLSHRSMVAQLYPQSLGSLFIASYVSQGYGGNIGHRLYTGFPSLTFSVSRLLLRLYVFLHENRRPLLGSDSVNTFRRQQICKQQSSKFRCYATAL